MKLFAYGTLRSRDKGVGNYLPATHTLPGFQMFNAGPFPYIVPGEGVVRGNLLDVDEDSMRGYDRYEGAPLFYSRETAIALDSETGKETPVYVYQGRSVASRNGALIKSGDWTEVTHN